MCAKQLKLVLSDSLLCLAISACGKQFKGVLSRHRHNNYASDFIYYAMLCRKAYIMWAS